MVPGRVGGFSSVRQQGGAGLEDQKSCSCAVIFFVLSFSPGDVRKSVFRQ